MKKYILILSCVLVVSVCTVIYLTNSKTYVENKSSDSSEMITDYYEIEKLIKDFIEEQGLPASVVEKNIVGDVQYSASTVMIVVSELRSLYETQCNAREQILNFIAEKNIDGNRVDMLIQE